METFPENRTKEEGINLLKSGQVAEAIEVFKKLLESDPADAQMHMLLGVTYMQNNDKLHAIRHLEESLNIKETPKGYYNLGLVYEKANRVDEAIRQYKMALELDPEYVNAQGALANMQAQYAAAHPQAVPDPAPADPAGGPAPWESTQYGVAAQGAAVAAPPQSGPPNWQELQDQKELQIKQAHKALLKNGLTYGAICGGLFFILLNLLFGMLLASQSAKSGILFLAMQGAFGAVYGALIGLWMGYTAGDENAGMQAGAVIAFVYGVISGLIEGAGGFALVQGLICAFFGAVGGYIIGRLVESSIQQV